MTSQRACHNSDMRPEDMSIHMLISEIAKITHDWVRKESALATISSGYRQIIFHLSHHNGITQFELAHMMHLTPPTISISIRKMEAEGYVARTPDPKDLRISRLTLTEKGKSIEDSIREKFKQIDALSVENMTEGEIDSLRRLLLKVRKNVMMDEKEEGPC